MHQVRQVRPRAAVVGAMIVLGGVWAFAQARNDPNAQPNPYRLVMNWATLPANMKWGQTIALDFDAHGDVYVFHRNDPGILKFNPRGELLKSWGAGLFAQAHGLSVDRFGYIWTADSDAKDGKGGQVFKFDSDGTLLMTLGKKGVLEESSTGEAFIGPTGVAVAANADIFVADGHVNNGNHRILKFSKDGRFIKAWGKTGSAPGEFNGPHGIAMDSRGRLFVADRGNKRVQVFDQEGRFLAEWPQFGSPENIYITKDDTLYVSDSNSSASNNSPYERGIRVGSARDGSVTYFIPEESYDARQPAATGPVGLGVDPQGNVYAADVGATVGFDKMMKKYVK